MHGAADLGELKEQAGLQGRGTGISGGVCGLMRRARLKPGPLSILKPASCGPASPSMPGFLSGLLALLRLPYPVDALKPAIDSTTMAIHHNRHHQAYVNNLNAAVAADPVLQGLTLDALLARLSMRSDPVRNNAGGLRNHPVFRTSLTRPCRGGEPASTLAAAIEGVRFLRGLRGRLLQR
ncbi:hypothetical protein [Synechococcus sp. J7-Johnson]|uniref:superoxide dismutase n=1 Tax=Synechococcus sp. J7-Johnson TaxID=2823737 RepID=UPI0028F3F8BD|nr:hypothetical protein [Synechococcus sp. J7-Johnson]